MCIGRKITLVTTYNLTPLGIITTRMMKTRTLLLSWLVAALLLAGCTGEDGSTGRLNLFITDAPIDGAEIKSAFIAINSIELKGPNGWKTIKSFDRPLAIDLLKLQHGESMLISEQYVDAGEYSAIRLALNAQEPGSGLIKSPGCNLVTEAGTLRTLFATTNNQNKVIEFPLQMPPDGISSYTLDFDLRKSVIKTAVSEDLFLDPTIRIVNNEKAATIAATFSMEAASSGVVIYAYKQGNFSTLETSRSDNQMAFSQATTSVRLRQNGSFVLGFLAPGKYDLVFTKNDSNGDLISVMGLYKNVDLSPKEFLELNIRLSDLEN